jgi:UPF0755 protein
MAKRISCGLVVLLLLAGGGAYAWWTWLNGQIAPTAPTDPFYVRFSDETPLLSALETLKDKGVVRNPSAFELYSRIKKKAAPIATGTYQVNGGMTANQVLLALHKPVVQMVRLPETNWAARSANILAREQVVESADDYMALVKQPELFKDEVDFPLPKDSLEGYLYPDTYDLPPLLGAKETIVKQLKAFQEKVYDPLGKPRDLQRLITIASMVQLEVMKDDERPKVAGVIENRLKRPMRLQIDATLLYGIQKWRLLTLKDYREIDSPYNTYTHDGLPPGPICSPSVKSVEAALNPAKHEYIFYVAKPDGYHIFASTNAGHEANIAKARHLRRELALREAKTKA